MNPSAAPATTSAQSPEELTQAGLSWKFYGDSDIWDTPLFIKDISSSPSIRSSQIINDAENNDLPSVSFVTPDTAGESDHPPSSPLPAQNFVASIVNAIMNERTAWSSTAIFVTWDDFGGFYDNVPPPQVDGNGLGPRVPLLVISPYAKPGYISDVQGDFQSPPLTCSSRRQFRTAQSGSAELQHVQPDGLLRLHPEEPCTQSLVQPMLNCTNVLAVPNGKVAAASSAERSSVTPKKGTQTPPSHSPFLFEQHAPTTHNVIVDGTAYNMPTSKLLYGDVTRYEYTTTLAAGPHSYSFLKVRGPHRLVGPAPLTTYRSPGLAGSLIRSID